jgi:hypothetical protein
MRTLMISTFFFGFLLALISSCGGKSPKTDKTPVETEGEELPVAIPITGFIRNIVTKDALENVSIKNYLGTEIDTTDQNGKFSVTLPDGNPLVLNFTKDGQAPLRVNFRRLSNLDSLVLFMEDTSSTDLIQDHYFRGRILHKTSNGNRGLKDVYVFETQTRLLDSSDESGWYSINSAQDEPHLNYYYTIVSTGKTDSIRIDIVNQIRDSARIDLVLNDKVTGININEVKRLIESGDN